MSILKQGEIKAIENNFCIVKDETTGKYQGVMKNNSILLASNHEKRIVLRTNGSVVYGTYYQGDEKIRFTHNFYKYKQPFVATQDYLHLKDIILKAWKETFDAKAQAKLQETINLVNSLAEKQKQTLTKLNSNTDTNKIDKKEVNNNMNTKDMSVMAIAHLIRRELKLEGHYYVQMKIAMSYAWQVKKGQIEIESLLNNNITLKTAKATCTYNAEQDFDKVNKYFEDRVTKMCDDNNIHATDATRIIMDTKAMVIKAIEEQDTTDMSARDLTIAIRKPIFKSISDAVQEQAEINAIEEAKKAEESKEPVVNTDESFRLYLASFKDGVARFVIKRMSDGAIANFLTKKARNMRNLDEILGAEIGTAIAKCPNNTVIEYYGQYTYLSVFNNPQLKALAESKGITLEQGTAPSGDAA